MLLELATNLRDSSLTDLILTLMTYDDYNQVPRHAAGQGRDGGRGGAQDTGPANAGAAWRGRGSGAGRGGARSWVKLQM